MQTLAPAPVLQVGPAALLQPTVTIRPTQATTLIAVWTRARADLAIA